jgi:hypothetical protein
VWYQNGFNVQGSIRPSALPAAAGHWPALAIEPRRLTFVHSSPVAGSKRSALLVT